MNAKARQNITLKMLDPQGEWDDESVVVRAGETVTFIDDPDVSETELVIDTSRIPGVTWLWAVPHYWFDEFDDLPTWDKVVELLHENGLGFSATFDSYRLDGDIDRPVMNLNFYRDDGSKDDYRMGAEDATEAVGLMNNRWTALSPVHALDGCELFVTVFPEVYTENVGKLLTDSLDVIENLKDLVSDRIETALDAKDESEWSERYSFVEKLVNRLQEALNG